MSDRDDFEENISVANGKLKKETENDEKNEIYSTKRKITHIIRQNPLAHMGEKSEKPTVLEKLRRAFSTEDTYSGGFIADDEPEGGGLLGESDDIFSEFVSKLRNARANKDAETETEKSIQTSSDTDITENNNQLDEADENKEAEEEFALLNSFLDSGTDDKTSEDEPPCENLENNTEFDEKQNSDEQMNSVSDEIEMITGVEEDSIETDVVGAESEQTVSTEMQAEHTVIDSDDELTVDKLKTQPDGQQVEVTEENTYESVSDAAGTESKQMPCDSDVNVEEQTDESKSVSPLSEQQSESSVNKLKNKTKQLLGSTFNGVKSICLGTKSKLVEMWNEKTPSIAQNSEVFESDEPIPTEQNTDSVMYAELVGSSDDSENSYEIIKEKETINTDSNFYDTSEHEFSGTDESLTDNQGIQMTVIKNETSSTMEIDTAEVRKNLNVITNENSDADDDFEILLEEPSIVNSEPDFSAENAKNVENPHNVKNTEFSDGVESTDESNISDTDRQQMEANQKVLDKVKEYERKAKLTPKSSDDERSVRAYEKEFGEIKPITQIEINDYLLPGQVEEIKVKAGKFSESVRAEYEFYIGYKRLQSVAKSQSRSSNKTDEEKVNSFESEKTVDYSDITLEQLSSEQKEQKEHLSKANKSAKSASKGIEYRSEDDQERIKKYILKDYKKSKLRFAISAVLTVATFILFCFNGKFAATTAEMAVGETGAERVFAVINLLMFGTALYTCRDILMDGLLPLRKLKVSTDTSVAFACVITAVQAVLVLIAPTFFFSQSLNVYTLLALLALTLNSYGRYMTAKRAKGNFAFVISSFNKYTARFYHDPRMTAKILSNTSIKNSKIVFQKRTSFLKNFIKLTYAEDEGERTSVKFVVPATVVSVIVSIIYAILSKSFLGAMSVLSVMLCMAVPMCCRLLGALPMYQLSKSALKNQAMVVGYPAVEHFSDSCAIMIDAKELYPEGSVHMNGIKTFSGRKIDDALFAAAAVMVNAGGAMAGMFDGIIQGNKEEVLPPVESLVYEDEKGLIGWVNNERVLVGNRFLLEKHGIEPPSLEYERKYRRNGDEILYLASSGELVAMFIIGYSANRRVMDALRRMESNGMSLLIRTVDVNITPERISKDFGIYHETVKILPTAMGNIIRDEMIGKEKSAPSYIATKGGVVPLGRAVSGCIKAKRNISLSIAIQAIEILLGLLLVTTIVLFSGIQAGIQQIGAIELFVFSLFWSVAVMIAPFIQKS